MKCPYCNREIYGMTGLMELQKFHKHLGKCRKNPVNIVLTDGQRTAITPMREQTMMDALDIRHESGQ